MKKFKRIIILVITLLVIGGISAFIYFEKGKRSIQVVEWDNVYNEKNIAYNFSEVDNPKIKELDNIYKIKESTKNEDTPLKKVLKVVELVNSVVSFDDVPNSKGINAYDILKEKKDAKKVSARDMAIITRDFISCLDLDVRVGEFRNPKGNINKQKNYYVVEYWSKVDNKWIMIDFKDHGYFENQGFLCSATELLEDDTKILKYNGNSTKKDYMDNLNKSLGSYTVAIDNSVDMKKSNSYVTYIKDKENITLDFKGGYILPTIYTEELELINKNPIDNVIGKDQKAYIILMTNQEAEANNKDKEEKSKSLIIGGFRNGSIIDSYYIKENSGEYKEVKRYSDVVLKPGENIIELSLDGKNVASKIVIECNE